jgi:hypothetical protein
LVNIAIAEDIFNFALDETLEVGCDLGEPVSPDYGPRGNDFNGRVKWVRIDIDAAAKDVDHLVGAEERFQLIMAKQEPPAMSFL